MAGVTPVRGPKTGGAFPIRRSFVANGRLFASRQGPPEAALHKIVSQKTREYRTILSAGKFASKMALQAFAPNWAELPNEKMSIKKQRRCRCFTEECQKARGEWAILYGLYRAPTGQTWAISGSVSGASARSGALWACSCASARFFLARLSLT